MMSALSNMWDDGTLTQWQAVMITSWGSTITLLFVCVVSVIYLLKTYRPERAESLSVGFIFCFIICEVTKWAVHRSRPEEFPGIGPWPSDPSFPSGHSMMSMFLYLQLGLYSRSKFLVKVAVIVSVLIGLSRIALGVHWWTDVVDGRDLWLDVRGGFVLLLVLARRTQ